MPTNATTPMSFNYKNVWKATPAIIGRLRNAMNISIIGFTPLIGDIATEFNISEKKMQIVIAVIGVVLNFLSHFFHVPIEGSSVPAADVTEIETH